MILYSSYGCVFFIILCSFLKPKFKGLINFYIYFCHCIRITREAVTL